MGSRILYLMGSYPCWSESFLRQDLTLLLEQGLPLLPVALFPGNVAMESGWPAVSVLAGDSGPAASDAAASSAPFGRRLLQRVLSPRWRGRVSRFRHRRLLHALCAMARRERVRHVHGEFADLPGLLAVYTARKLRLSYSLGVHAHDVFAAKYDPRVLYRRARFVTVCNTAAHDRLLSDCPEAGNRIELIHHGIELESWPFCDRLAAASGPWRILYAGRLVEKKGVPVLLQAVARMRETGSDVRLTLLGAGPEESRLRELGATLGIGANLDWGGVASPARVRLELQRADCLVVPSLPAANADLDGIPNIVIEAMATGTPVVGTAAGGIPEVLSDRTGWLCPPGDSAAIAACLRAMRQTPEGVGQRCRNARRLIEAEFDVRNLIRRRAALFETALAG